MLLSGDFLIEGVNLLPSALKSAILYLKFSIKGFQFLFYGYYLFS